MMNNSNVMSISALSNRGKTIGVLTVALIIPSLIVFFRVLIGGSWYTLGSFVEVFHIYAYVYYYAMVLPIVAATIGILVLGQRKWANKANIVFQIISIVIIIVDSVLVSTTFPMVDLVAKEFPKIISLVLSGIILALSFNKPRLTGQE